MKMREIETRAYCWRNQNGAWQVGKPLVADELLVSRPAVTAAGVGREILMQPSHASPPTWVRLDKLQPYPSEPIEEPIVKGGE